MTVTVVETPTRVTVDEQAGLLSIGVGGPQGTQGVAGPAGPAGPRGNPGTGGGGADTLGAIDYGLLSMNFHPQHVDHDQELEDNRLYLFKQSLALDVVVRRLAFFSWSTLAPTTTKILVYSIAGLTITKEIEALAPTLFTQMYGRLPDLGADYEHAGTTHATWYAGIYCTGGTMPHLLRQSQDYVGSRFRDDAGVDFAPAAEPPFLRASFAPAASYSIDPADFATPENNHLTPFIDRQFWCGAAAAA